jgi:hypothetical protein
VPPRSYAHDNNPMGSIDDIPAESGAGKASVIGLLKGILDKAPAEVTVEPLADMTITPTGMPTTSADYAAPGANAAASLIYATPGAGLCRVLSGIYWSLNADPPAGGVQLTISDGAVATYLAFHIVTAGPGFIPFPGNKKFPANKQIVINLPAGGAGVTGRVGVLGQWVEAE